MGQSEERTYGNTKETTLETMAQYDAGDSDAVGKSSNQFDACFCLVAYAAYVGTGI